MATIKKKAVKKSRKIARPKVVKLKSMGKLVGRITHYFSDIEVVVMKLSAPVKQGDEIRVVGGESTDFNQKITSMQFDHKEIEAAKKGQSVGLKIKEKAREGYKVYKI